jgi:importin subunit alpha-1
LLGSSEFNIQKEASWAVSNATSGRFLTQTRTLIQSLTRTLTLILTTDPNPNANATSGGAPEQILYLAQQGTIPPLCQLLQVADVKVVTVALEGLENILKAGQATSEKTFNFLVSMISDAGGLNAIEELQNHENQNIYHRAVKLLETYFGGEEEEESTIAPDVVSSDVGQQYGFGGPSGQAPQVRVFSLYLSFSLSIPLSLSLSLYPSHCLSLSLY